MIKKIVNKCKKNKKTRPKSIKHLANNHFQCTTKYWNEPTPRASQSLFGQHFTDFISVIHVHLLPVKYHQYFAA